MFKSIWLTTLPIPPMRQGINQAPEPIPTLSESANKCTYTLFPPPFSLPWEIEELVVLIG